MGKKRHFQVLVIWARGPGIPQMSIIDGGTRIDCRPSSTPIITVVLFDRQWGLGYRAFRLQHPKRQREGLRFTHQRDRDFQLRVSFTGREVNEALEKIRRITKRGNLPTIVGPIRNYAQTKFWLEEY